MKLLYNAFESQMIKKCGQLLFNGFLGPTLTC